MNSIPYFSQKNTQHMFAFIKNALSEKCPRCHQGNLFTHKWYQLKNITTMNKNCPVCGQRTELEPGFYHGTGYVSYGLTVGFSIMTFVVWTLSTGIGIGDERVLWWFPINLVLLLALQPWFMRISRVIWLTLFFHGDDKFHPSQGETIKSPQQTE